VSGSGIHLEEAIVSQALTSALHDLDDPKGLLARPDVLYEVVDGKVLGLPRMGAFSHFIALHLYNTLLAFQERQRSGTPVHEVVFILDPGGKLRRRPDVAFVSFDRWPADRAVPDEDWDVIPDLAVEVVSPNDRIDELMRKIRDYFQHGVRLVWVLQPALKQVYVYTSLTDVRVFEAGQELDGGEVLPGLRLAVEPLFRRTLG
jgi:Uma2 family endonuclease